MFHQFYPKHYDEYDFIFMMGFELISINILGPRLLQTEPTRWWFTDYCLDLYDQEVTMVLYIYIYIFKNPSPNEVTDACIYMYFAKAFTQPVNSLRPSDAYMRR